MIRIKEVEYLNEHKLKILFDDGKEKIVDFTNWIAEGGVYILPLRDIKYFKKVKTDEFKFSICWPNGANFSPDILYEMGVEFEEPKKQAKPQIKRRKQNMDEKTEFKYQSTAKAKRVSKKTKG